MKLTFEAQMTGASATSQASPHATKDAGLTPSDSCPAPTPGTGIFPFRFGPFFGGRHLVNVAWVKSSMGIYYEIWAGAADDAPGEGLIRIVQLDLDPCASTALGTEMPPMRDFTMPKGPLTITAIEGDTISFAIAGGGTGHFNFVADQFEP